MIQLDDVIQKAFNSAKHQWIDDPVISQWRSPDHHVHRVLSEANLLYHRWKSVQQDIIASSPFAAAPYALWHDTGHALAGTGLPWHNNQVNLPDQRDSSWPFHFKDYETQALQAFGSRTGDPNPSGYISSYSEANCYCIRALQQELRKTHPTTQPLLVYDHFDIELITSFERFLGLETHQISFSGTHSHIKEDLLRVTSNGARPIIFATTVGNFATESDNLRVIAELSTEFNSLLHVDAFRSFNYITTITEKDRQMQGMERLRLGLKPPNQPLQDNDGLLVASTVVAGGLNGSRYAPAAALKPALLGGGSRDAIPPLWLSTLAEIRTMVESWKVMTPSTAGYPLHMGSYSALGPVIGRFWGLSIPQDWLKDMSREILASRLQLFGVRNARRQTLFKGNFTNGSTMGNRCAIHTALANIPNGHIYFSAETHYSVAKTLRDCDTLSNRWSGGKSRYSEITCASDGSIDVQALVRQALLDKKRCMEAGREYRMIFLANIGTTFGGARDDLNGINRSLKNAGIAISYIHVDGAFDLGFDNCGLQLGPPGTTDAHGMPSIQGVTISHHKALGQMVSGVVLCLSPENQLFAPSSDLDPMIIFETWLYNRVYLSDDLSLMRTSGLEKAAYLERSLQNIGIATKRNRSSLITVLERPPSWIVEEFSLRPEGDWVHFITMPHISKHTVDFFISRIVSIDAACSAAFSCVAPLLSDIVERPIMLKRIQCRGTLANQVYELAPFLQRTTVAQPADAHDLGVTVKSCVRSALSIAVVDERDDIQVVIMAESLRDQSIQVGPLFIKAELIPDVPIVVEITKQLLVVFNGVRQVALEERPLPSIQEPSDIIVKVKYTALCGRNMSSELHVFRGHQKSATGFIMGHEFTGVVDSIGSSVQSVQPGDLIVCPFTISCGTCFYCISGFSSRCEQCRLFGCPLLDGGQAEYVRVPLADSTVVKAPPGIEDLKLCLMADIFPTGYFAASNALAKVKPEVARQSVVVVIGCGPVGLCALTAAVEYGPKVILAVDGIPERLATAKSLGAEPWNYLTAKEGLYERIKELTDGRGADVVIEVVGHSSALEMGFEILRPWGTISSVGVHNGAIPWSGNAAYGKNLTIQMGRCPVRSIFSDALQLLEKKQHLLNFMTETVMPLSDAVKGYDLFDAGKVHKVIFDAQK
ncbi:zinc-type alcohol dehydrogenase-like protein [Paramyrothecium foliicola]|nr:zinc-type alcohol dehydrogenase-like protein [Paramyrothecium foliicola]